MLIDNTLLDEVAALAKTSERLRMNRDMRNSTDDTSQRMLNALLPGTEVAIHRHEETAETVVCLMGKLEEVMYEEHLDENGGRIFAYEFNEYWKDVGTLSSYWQANMELVDIIPEFNLYEEYWKIYTKCDNVKPQYLGEDSNISRSIIAEGCEIYGSVENSVLGPGVVVEEGAEVRDSILMGEVTIGRNTKVEKAIIAEQTTVGADCELGVGEYAESKYDPKVYNADLVTIGECSVIPDGVKIGKNTAIMGITEPADYPAGLLESGGYIIKEGDKQ